MRNILLVSTLAAFVASGCAFSAEAPDDSLETTASESPPPLPREAAAVDGPLGDAQQAFEASHYCSRACGFVQLAGCRAVKYACEAAEGEGRDMVDSDGIWLHCDAAEAAACGDPEMPAQYLFKCEELCMTEHYTPGPSSGWVVGH